LDVFLEHENSKEKTLENLIAYDFLIKKLSSIRKRTKMRKRLLLDASVKPCLA
jgi:hypothetical protein